MTSIFRPIFLFSTGEQNGGCEPRRSQSLTALVKLINASNISTLTTGRVLLPEDLLRDVSVKLWIVPVKIRKTIHELTRNHPNKSETDWFVTHCLRRSRKQTSVRWRWCL